ncbi:unnamed protein product [Pleuronectes platessa]|uniref:Uncharacterized protein n=1 Tax=Pleuronectes platessa TaxID=8262 RepID=A0A9N7TWI1_PLEPL|nr:unnamed protein product [Pleuronectes platessa]
MAASQSSSGLDERGELKKPQIFSAGVGLTTSGTEGLLQGRGSRRQTPADPALEEVDGVSHASSRTALAPITVGGHAGSIYHCMQRCATTTILHNSLDQLSSK